MGKPSLDGELRRLRKALRGCCVFGALSVGDAARLVKVDAKRLRAEIASGRLRTVRVRGETMIPRSELALFRSSY